MIKSRLFICLKIYTPAETVHGCGWLLQIRLFFPTFALKCMRFMKAFSKILLLILLLSASTVSAQVPDVSLLTVGPGSEVYELEGHTMLRLRYPDGRDQTVNWGVFDFNSPNFIYRFVKGETDYIAAEAPTAYVIESYRRENRSVTEQRLNLSAAEISKLTSLIDDNLRPENRVYRYNYVKDNCATRPLNIIEKSVQADSCELVTNVVESEGSTFRNEMRRYHRRFPTYQFGIDLALGSGIDYQISSREKTFAPVYLMEYLAKTNKVDSSGNEVPLVASTEVLVEGSSEPAAEGGIPLWLIVYGFLAVVIAVTLVDLKRRKVTKWFDALFFLVYGIAGCVIFFLVFVSVHEATSPNLNLLWLNPLALIVPALIWVKRAKKIVFCYQITNFALVLAFIVGLLFTLQSTNALFLPLIAASLLRSANYIIINR